MHTIRLFGKSNFCPKIQFWQNPNIFTSFFTQIFLTIFLVKSKLSTAKKSKTTTFSRVFHPNFFWQFFSWNQSCQQLKIPKPKHFHEFFTPKNQQFSREIKVEFLDKKWRFRTVWFHIVLNFWWWLGYRFSFWLRWWLWFEVFSRWEWRHWFWRLFRSEWRISSVVCIGFGGWKLRFQVFTRWNRRPRFWDKIFFKGCQFCHF